MKVTAPHLGTAYVPLKAVFEELGVEYIVPPFSSSRTLSLGTRYSPEFVCSPYKIILGNFIEALEQGADTLLFIEGGGLCRLGYYARLIEPTLRDLGYSFRMITTRLFERRVLGIPGFLRLFAPDASLKQILRAMRFGLAKVSALDDVERAVHQVRARESVQGAADQVWREAVGAIDAADSIDALKQAQTKYVARLHEIPQNEARRPVKVGIIGEFYVVLEPFSNLDVEKELGKLGAEVHRTIMLSNWTWHSLFLSALGLSHHKQVHQAAMPYLHRDVSGDGWESVGETVLHGRADYDGMVHLAPFTCMPELVAQNLLAEVSRDYQIPVLSLTCDEQMGRSGLVTRLEAFVDLLRRRRKSK